MAHNKFVKLNIEIAVSVDDVPEEELEDYELVENWEDELKSEVASNINHLFGEHHPFYSISQALVKIDLKNIRQTTFAKLERQEQSVLSNYLPENK